MNSRKLGFSLVELLVVISIIMIITTITRAGEVREPTVFRDRVVFAGSTAPEFHNGLSIDGTPVTLASNLVAGGVSGSATVVTNVVLTLQKDGANVTNATLTVQTATFNFASGVCTNKPQ